MKTCSRRLENVTLLYRSNDSDSNKKIWYSYSITKYYTRTVLRIRIRRNRMFLDLRIRIHYHEEWMRIRLRILLSSSKNRKNNLDPTVLRLLYDFLFLKNDVNGASKTNKPKKFIFHLEGHWRKWQDPDPLVRDTDPQIRIRTICHRSATLTRIVGFFTCSSSL